MSIAVPIETAKRDLESFLEQLPLGETITLVNSEGTPVAVLVSLKPVSVGGESTSDWEKKWDELAQKISHA